MLHVEHIEHKVKWLEFSVQGAGLQSGWPMVNAIVASKLMPMTDAIMQIRMYVDVEMGGWLGWELGCAKATMHNECSPMRGCSCHVEYGHTKGCQCPLMRATGIAAPTATAAATATASASANATVAVASPV